MLLQLAIENVAIIDKLIINMGEGLNILTGETGAGKSIIIDSINAILGERVSKDLIRNGQEKAFVEAMFQIDSEETKNILEEFGIEIDEDGTLIVQREFNVNSKNFCRINGKLVTVSMLKKIGEHLIDVHGQNDNQSLLRTDNHIKLLDLFAGKALKTYHSKYLEKRKLYKEIKSKLIKLVGDTNEIERKKDLLRYQIDEITNANLLGINEEDLIQKRTILLNSEKISDSLSAVYELLYSGTSVKTSALDNIGEAIKEITRISALDTSQNEILTKLEDITYSLEDVISDVRNNRENVEQDPQLLSEVEQKIELINNLKRKYGNTIEEILIYSENIQKELESINNSEETINNYKKELNKLSIELYELAKYMHEERVKAAQIIESRISDELKYLEMKNTKFEVKIEFNVTNGEKEYDFSLNGLDNVEFMIATNQGEPVKSLSKIASGGEMSRIMLAIKTILAQVDDVPTLIFDEIDTGISGRAAEKVGIKLAFIARNHQVICVTHLAQIACIADYNYLIEKQIENNKTRTSVRKLSENEIKHEISRIIGGTNISEITLKHAEELIINARENKSIN